MTLQERSKEELALLGQQGLAPIGVMRQKQEEARHLYAKLEMLYKVMAQGINPNDVRAYTYDPKLDHRKPVACWYRVEDWKKANPVYNVAIFHDGTRLEIKPVAVP
jgi:hypothetical protein